MKNIVVCVGWDRPEFMYLALDYIKKADGFDNYEYVFALDRGFDARNLDLIKDFPCKSYVVTPEPHRFKAGRQSCNVVNGLLSACSLKPELIFYIEDDVFIGKDFFTFIESVHAKEPDLFEVICSHNVNSVDVVTDNPDAYYVKENTNVHQGIGNCFKAAMLEPLLTPHFCYDYFQNPKLYVEAYYPDSALNSNFSEQDGLIRRIIEKNALKVAFSHVPRCFHAGFYGYNRTPHINYLRMSFEQRIELIRQYSFSPEMLSGIVQAQNLVEDSMPVNLETTHNEVVKINL